MRFLKLAACPLILAGAACAKSVPVENTPAPSTAAAVTAAPGEARWTASLNPVQERTAEIRQTSTNRSRGSFTMTHGDNPGWSRVTLNFNANSASSENSTAAWAIVPGSCGSDAAPVLPVSAFPTIELGGSGSGQVSSQIHFDFPLSGNYHVNVYRSGGIMNADARSIAAVLACGNLKFQK
jgi:hypothetical protein